MTLGETMWLLFGAVMGVTAASAIPYAVSLVTYFVRRPPVPVPGAVPTKGAKSTIAD